ncbi:MAG: hypothetical protein ACTSWD_04745 [Candidatus Heimdallarchaeota archaeon]
MTLEKRVEVLEGKVSKIEIRLLVLEKKVIGELGKISKGIKTIKGWIIGAIIITLILFGSVVGRA